MATIGRLAGLFRYLIEQCCCPPYQVEYLSGRTTLFSPHSSHISKRTQEPQFLFSGCPNQEILGVFLFKGLNIGTCAYFFHLKQIVPPSQVEHPSGRTTLAIIPAKFNKKLWIKTGGYIIIEDCTEAVEEGSNKITGQVVRVLYEDSVKALMKMPGVW
jgi:hypothetical protein